MSEPLPQPHDAAVTLMRAAIDELRSIAHDPQMVHAIADKLKHGIDMLADALTEQPKDKPKA